MNRCACGNMTYNPEGICKICRRKGNMLKPPDTPAEMPTTKSKYPICPECGKKFVDKAKLFVHMNATGHRHIKDPMTTKEDVVMRENSSERKCKQEGCEKYPAKKGMCLRHYKESIGLPVRGKGNKLKVPGTAHPQVEPRPLPERVNRHLTIDLSDYPKTLNVLEQFAPKNDGELLVFLLKDDLKIIIGGEGRLWIRESNRA